MRAFVINLCRFFLFTLVFYPVFILLLGILIPNVIKKNLVYTRGGNGFTYQRMQDAKQVEDIDLLFIGSSRSYRGFDTRIFSDAGYTCFNLGTSNQTPIQSLRLLKSLMGKKLSPKTVIMEVNPDLFSNDGVESTLDLLSNETNYKDRLKWLWIMPDIKVLNTFIYACWMSLGSFDTFPNKVKTQQYVKGGYVSNETDSFNINEGNTYECKVLPKQLKAFEEMVAFLKARQVSIILIQSPIDQSLYQLCPPEQSFEDLMSQSAPYYNFNTIKDPFKTDLFSDKQHLNQKGVSVFNHKVLQILANR